MALFEASIQKSVVSAMSLVNEHGYKSVAFPVIGAGTGGFGEDGALRLMQQAFMASTRRLPSRWSDSGAGAEDLWRSRHPPFANPAGYFQRWPLATLNSVKLSSP